jgi:glycerol-3-phosphate dehydrogenase subunit B
MSVLVVGAGVAGTAAALAASRAGAKVTVVDGGTGASTQELGVVLGVAVVVTSAAHPRAAQGREASLLDLHPLLASRPQIGVVRCARPGWSADGLVRAAERGFFPLDAVVLRHADERTLPDPDFAARHDDDARLAWLAERLREGITRSQVAPTGLLLPPSLGLKRSRAADLSQLLGVPCGEAMGLPGGPCGLRFESARDGAFAAADITVVRGRATGVERDAGRWRIAVDGGSLTASAVVIAAGGLIGGGIEYQPSEAMVAAALPPRSRPAFGCTIAGPLPVGAHGRPLELPGSLFGVPPEELAWPHARDPLMDRAGVLCGEEGRVDRGLYAAGEIVADLPRTWLHALSSGVRAGAAAARDGITVPAERPSSSVAAPASRP